MKILAEAENESQNWSNLGLENLFPATADSPSPSVKEFVNGYHVLQEMGFSANNVAEALLMYDNDADKALAHFLGGSP
ncbi:unnamed protein product [Thlaspi arvense]|uniref:Ubiquitin-associated protein 1-like UBA2 domain-containing protein n=1 Tax=Thlaspi arvense TaxID=13288 RepID=A0AAU9RWZ6_THLAR|nr:unnamed protein product [Thlaspi arvense]